MRGQPGVPAEFLYGCVRLRVLPAGIDEKGKPFEDFYFDEQRLKVMHRAGVQVSEDADAEGLGGPRANPTRNRDPLAVDSPAPSPIR